MNRMCAAVSLFIAGACVAQSAVIGTLAANRLGVISVLSSTNDPWIRISLHQSVSPAFQCPPRVIVTQCVLIARYFGLGDVGTTHSVNAANHSDFSILTGIFSNGRSDSISFYSSFRGPNFVEVGGHGFYDGSILPARPGGDLLGFAISQIDIRLDSMRIAPFTYYDPLPGRYITGTEVSYGLTITFQGTEVPEPGAAILLLCGAGSMLLAKRRRV